MLSIETDKAEELKAIQKVADSIQKLIPPNQRCQIQISWNFMAKEWQLFLSGEREIVEQLPDEKDGFLIYKIPINYI